MNFFLKLFVKSLPVPTVLKNKILYEYVHECSGTPSYGDVIFCRRYVSIYKHFGIYVGSGKVIHFAPRNGDIGSEAYIHETTIEEFADGNTVYIMDFPEEYECGSFLRYIVHKDEYQLQSPHQTVERARMLIGKRGIDGDEYHFLVNNCENFAIWCKTNVAECRQLNSWIDSIMP